jgi:hypothetical protein
VTKEERRAEWLRVTMALNDLNADFKELTAEQRKDAVVITNKTFGKVVEYLIQRKQELA